MTEFNAAVINKGVSGGDDYKRFEVSTGSGVYQCGCHWDWRNDEFGEGDILVQCAIHNAATLASVRSFDKEFGWKGFQRINT